MSELELRVHGNIALKTLERKTGLTRCLIGNVCCQTANLLLGHSHHSIIGYLIGSTNKLTLLDVSSSNVSDLTPLAGLTNLEDLYISNSPLLTSLNGIQTMSSLIGIDLTQNDLDAMGNLEALVVLPGLKYIGAYDSNLTDISALAQLPNIEQVYFGENNFTDISSMQFLTKLWLVDISGSPVTDLSPLIDNPDFADGSKLVIRNNAAICEAAGMDEIQALQSKGVLVYDDCL